MQNKKLVASVVLVLISFVCASQTDPPPPGPPPGPGLPIDGGVIIGACIALFYGVKKLLDSK